MSIQLVPTTMKYRTIAATIAVLTGTAVAANGGVAGATASSYPPSSDASQSQHMPQQYSQAAVDLRVGMNNLLREHVSVSLDATRSIADDASQWQIDGAIAAQYSNSDDLAAAVGSVYGDEAEAKFSELFREHIVESNKYAMAVANDDEAAKEEALEELQEYLNDIAVFFSDATGLPSQAIYDLLNEHEGLINESTEAYKEGDYAKSYELEREALMQISGAADALAAAVVSSQPDKFKY